LHTQYGDIATYIGADPNTAMLERARKLAGTKPIQFVKTYADLLPLADNSCDWVVCTLAFHHISNETKPACIKEMLRVLKPSGTMLIVDIGRPQGVFGRFFAFFSHSHAFVKDNMETVEKALIGNNAEITKRDYQFGFIEYLTIKKE
jgi:ubiquinone/menaquinone biosynthesis C-methylase UbiE